MNHTVLILLLVLLSFFLFWFQFIQQTAPVNERYTKQERYRKLERYGDPDYQTVSLPRIPDNQNINSSSHPTVPSFMDFQELPSLDSISDSGPLFQYQHNLP